MFQFFLNSYYLILISFITSTYKIILFFHKGILGTLKFYLFSQFSLSITPIKSLTNFHKIHLQFHSFYPLNLLKKTHISISSNPHKFIFTFSPKSIFAKEHNLNTLNGYPPHTRLILYKSLKLQKDLLTKTSCHYQPSSQSSSI